ncbi:MAG TPA: TonB-dependent receptor [Cellvibrio sp.]|nr:TonB-dependent receptor [Cellvibrio sp.]
MTRALVCNLPLVVLAGAFSCSACALSGQEATLEDYLSLSLAELSQVKISIATGSNTAFDKTPATASIIHSSEIAAMGAKTLDEVLETVAGFHVSISTISRMDSVYSIRGMHTGLSPQVLLLLDGIPVQSMQSAKPSLFRLPVAAIERVEVIRGPGSAIYGADAFSGVINIITKDAYSMGDAQVGVGSGSFNSHEFWAQGATEWRGWGIAFSTNYLESDGDKSRRIDRDAQSALDSIFGTEASLAPGAVATRYQVLNNHLNLNSEQFDINIWGWLSQDAGIGAGATQALDPTGYDDSSLWQADVTYHLPQWSEEWDTDFRVSYQRYHLTTHFTLFPAGVVLPIGSSGNVYFHPSAGIVQFPDGLFGNPESVRTDTAMDFISSFTGWDAHRIRVATGVRYVKAVAEESKNFGPGVLDGSSGVRDGSLVDVSNSINVFMLPQSSTVSYISLQDEWQIAQSLALTSGVRYDHYSDFGGTTNPRLALVWSANQDVTTKLLYGSAFRAPSFMELYFQNNPVSLGNTQLHPERMDTLEMGVNYRLTGELQTSFTVFKYLAQDLIEFTPDRGARTQTAQNARDQEAVGIEWELNWKPSAQWHLSGSYSWQNARDKQTREDIADAPGQQIKLNAKWEFAPRWFISSQAYYVADRQRIEDDYRLAVDDYTLMNLSLRREKILRNLDISLTVRNIADTKAYEPSSLSLGEDYPLEQRSSWVELRYLFN